MVRTHEYRAGMRIINAMGAKGKRRAAFCGRGKRIEEV